MQVRGAAGPRSADTTAIQRPAVPYAGALHLIISLLAAGAVACGDDPVEPTTEPTLKDATVEQDTGYQNILDAGVIGDAEPAGDAETTEDAGDTEDASPAPDAAPPDGGFVDAGVAPPPDPALPGPHTVTQLATDFVAPLSGNTVRIDCRFPSDTRAAHPMVIIGHGFQIPATQYAGYAVRLATFGYVACTVEFEASLIADHIQNTEDFLAGLDYVLGLSRQSANILEDRIDTGRIGAMGHSLGGKVAFMAADLDGRIGAVFGLDPVDGSSLCIPFRCPDASALLPFTIPVAVIGETVDATSSLQACAPLADNFQTFYDAASSPAVEIDVFGANHMSFIEDPLACGLPCALCNPASVLQQDVLALARAITVAFFERHLKGNTAYDTYLSGPTAQQRYVQTRQAGIRSK